MGLEHRRGHRTAVHAQVVEHRGVHLERPAAREAVVDDPCDFGHVHRVVTLLLDNGGGDDQLVGVQSVEGRRRSESDGRGLLHESILHVRREPGRRLARRDDVLTGADKSLERARRAKRTRRLGERRVVDELIREGVTFGVLDGDRHLVQGQSGTDINGVDVGGRAKDRTHVGERRTLRDLVGTGGDRKRTKYRGVDLEGERGGDDAFGVHLVGDGRYRITGVHGDDHVLALTVENGVDLKGEPRHHDDDDDHQTRNNPAQWLTQH